MFKSIKGFDPDVFKPGTPIVITDSYTPSTARFMSISHNVEGYFDMSRNQSGTYLVQRCNLSSLRVTNSIGKQGEFMIDSFIGNDPRMSIAIYDFHTHHPLNIEN